MPFGIKMEDFHCKACLVAGGHMTDVFVTFIYTSVIICKNVYIALMLAALNLVDVMVADL